VAVAGEAPEVLRNLFELLTEERIEMLTRTGIDGQRLFTSRHATEVGATGRGDSSCAHLLSGEILSWARRWRLAGYDGEQFRGRWVLVSACDTLAVWALTGCREPRQWALPTWGGWQGESANVAPGADHAEYRPRAKRALGDQVQLMRTVPDWHLHALARWQVLGEGVELVRKRWAEVERRRHPKDGAACIRRLRGLASAFDLPPRTNAAPGRPRRVAVSG
jgi:hypothetical protein